MQCRKNKHLFGLLGEKWGIFDVWISRGAAKAQRCMYGFLLLKLKISNGVMNGILTFLKETSILTFKFFGANPAIRYIFFDKKSKKDAAAIRAKTGAKAQSYMYKKPQRFYKPLRFDRV